MATIFSKLLSLTEKTSLESTDIMPMQTSTGFWRWFKLSTLVTFLSNALSTVFASKSTEADVTTLEADVTTLQQQAQNLYPDGTIDAAHIVDVTEAKTQAALNAEQKNKTQHLNELGQTTASHVLRYDESESTEQSFEKRPTLAANQQKTIAANDSSAEAKKFVDYQCDGVSDYDQMNNAIAALGSGKILLRKGNYDLGSEVSIASGDFVIEGEGIDATIISRSTGANYFNNTGGGVVILRNLTLSEAWALPNVRLENCKYNGQYVQLDPTAHTHDIKDDISNSNGEKRVAASDSGTTIRKYAHYLCDGVNDYFQINQAATDLGNGKIIISAGNYDLGSQITISAGNFVIQGEGVDKTILNRNIGSFYISNTGSGAVILRDLSLVGDLVTDNVVLINCKINGNYVAQSNIQKAYAFFVAAYDAPDDQKLAADYVALDENDGGTIVRALITSMTDGGIIQLSEGTFGNGLDFRNANVTVQGMGYNTQLTRASGNVVYSSTNSDGGVLRNLRFATIEKADQPLFRIENCWCDLDGNGETLLSDHYDMRVNVLKVGVNERFKNFTQAYNFIDANLWDVDTWWEIHVYGHVVETARLNIHKANVDIIGHNATIETNNTTVLADQYGFEGAIFTDPESASYGTTYNGRVYNVTFKRTGNLDAWNFAACKVQTEGVTFYNCRFENESGTITQTMTTTPTDYNGDRRHGLYCLGGTYYNCVGKGSADGFHNTRGIYVLGRTPKLFNCIGIGGGKGLHGHGIILHRSSNAELHNCIGIAGGVQKSYGIKFQNATTSRLYSCVGFALDTNNETIGVDGEAIETGGIGVDYFAKPQLIDCCGYHGNGINSYGLHVYNTVRSIPEQGGFTDGVPEIVGGYFGVRRRIESQSFVKDSGFNYMTTAIATTPITLLDWGYYDQRPSAADYIILKTSGGDTIVNENTGENNLPYALAAGEEVVATFYDATDTEITPDDDSFSFIWQYEDNQAGCYALNWDKKEGSITSAKFRSNLASHCIYLSAESQANNWYFDKLDAECGNPANNVLQAESAHANVPISHSRLNGALSNITSFKSVTQLLSSSNYK